MIFLNDYILEPTTFPDGTQQVWKLPLNQFPETIQVTWLYKSQDEIIQLLQLDDLLHHSGVQYHLRVGYLPFARQDKTINNLATFGLHTFIKVLGLLQYKSISVFHPHSSVVEAIPNLHVDRGFDFFVLNNHTLIFPDKGAAQNYQYLVDRGYPYIICGKVRNPQTGEIESVQVVEDHGAPNLPHVIVDDICDGGATFIEIAKLFPHIPLALYVAHGFFSKGLGHLKEAGISEFYCHLTLDQPIPKGVIVICPT